MNDSERYLAALEHDANYRAARIQKLRRQYRRMFVTGVQGRLRRLNEIETELVRLGDK